MQKQLMGFVIAKPDTIIILSNVFRVETAANHVVALDALSALN
jgi:hypothetical protein